MKKFFLFLLFCNAVFLLIAQPVTGVWRGKITTGSGMFANTGKVELKLIAKGDSLVGTCYYFSNTNSYLRYSVKGYFDKEDNAVHWWDDQFLGAKPAGKITVSVYDEAMRSEADFNCPGGKVMKLDGKSKIGKEGPEFVLHFDKMEKPFFKDEWDNVIEGYFTGMADPEIIDSVYAITPPYHPEIPTEVVAKLNPPKGNNKNRGNGDLESKAPIEEAVKNPAGTNEKTPGAVSTETKTGLVKADPGLEKVEEKPLMTTVAEVKKTDSLLIAKQQPVKDNSTSKQENELKEKTTVSSLPPSTENQSKKPVINNTTATTKPAVVTPSTISKSTDATANKTTSTQPVIVTKSVPVEIKPLIIPQRIDPVAVQKFETRKKINQGEILISGDSIELNFYDNAEVDGDSISLFVNGRLLFNHVLLSAQAYTFKLDVKDLPEGSELTMVAENLGSIPPNTAYMMAIVNGQRYTARLESTEQSSGVIKLVRRQ